MPSQYLVKRTPIWYFVSFQIGSQMFSSSAASFGGHVVVWCPGSQQRHGRVLVSLCNFQLITGAACSFILSCGIQTWCQRAASYKENRRPIERNSLSLSEPFAIFRSWNLVTVKFLKCRIPSPPALIPTPSPAHLSQLKPSSHISCFASLRRKRACPATLLVAFFAVYWTAYH